MRVKLLVVGMVKEEFYRNKIKQYQNRIKKYLPFEMICVKDESIPKQASQTVLEKIKTVEGEKILASVKNTDYVVALCIDGQKMNNQKIKKCFSRAAACGRDCVTFMIGGSLGLSDAVVKRADMKISFSDMTFPHQLMRVMLLEVLEKELTCDK